MKNTRSISSMLDKLSATAMKCLSVTQMLSKTHLESTLQNNKTCTSRHSYGEYSQLLIESNQSCLKIIAMTGWQRDISNPVENLRRSFLAKIIKF